MRRGSNLKTFKGSAGCRSNRRMGMVPTARAVFSRGGVCNFLNKLLYFSLMFFDFTFWPGEGRGSSGRQEAEDTMPYLLVFLEGVATFVSPCMLPMLPIYVAYFSAGSGKRKALSNALGFVLGFTLVFMAMGAAAGTIGQFLSAHQRPMMQVAGTLSILLGLIYAGLIPAPIARLLKGIPMNPQRLERLNFLSSVLFGFIFAVGWTPCIGVFLSAALLMAAGAGHTLTGVLMLLCFSLGLGIPFVMAALLLEKMGEAFAFLKRHMLAINRIGGAFLVLVGIAMIGGWLDWLLAALL